MGGQPLSCVGRYVDAPLVDDHGDGKRKQNVSHQRVLASRAWKVSRQVCSSSCQTASLVDSTVRKELPIAPEVRIEQQG